MNDSQTAHPALSDPEEKKNLIQDILDKARKLGATQAEAGLTVSQGLSVSARQREVETLEYQQDNGLGISVYFGQHKGSASTSNLDPKAIEQTLEAACNIAKYTSEDPCTGLADEALMATEFAELDLYHPWDIAAEKAIELALECEAAALDADERINNSEGASVETSNGLSVYGNTHGFLQAQRKSRHSVYCAVVAETEQGMQRDYWYDMRRDAGQLQSGIEIGRKAAQRTVDRLDARKIKTGESPVLFVPEMARGLIGHLTSAIGGGAQYRKANFLLDALDEQIFPEFVELKEHPFESCGLGSANYDGEGVAVRENVIVSKGVLNSYLLNSYAARKLDRVSTGHASGVHNLTLADTGKDFAAMLKALDTGLLVTELMGQGVNTVTGDYSRGAAGFWVENGEIQYPVEEITIAGQLRDMFMGIAEIGSDIDNRGNTRCGSILLERMMIAGES